MEAKATHCGDSEWGGASRVGGVKQSSPFVLPCKQHPTFSGAFVYVIITPGTEWYFLASNSSYTRRTLQQGS